MILEYVLLVALSVGGGPATTDKIAVYADIEQCIAASRMHLETLALRVELQNKLWRAETTCTPRRKATT